MVIPLTDGGLGNQEAYMKENDDDMQRKEIFVAFIPMKSFSWGGGGGNDVGPKPNSRL